MKKRNYLVPTVMAAAAAVTGAAYYCYRSVYTVDRAKCANPKKQNPEPQYEPFRENWERQIEQVLTIPCEPVSFRTADGLELCGRYYAGAPGAPVQILFHGYRANPLRDFCVGLPLALKLGCNVLLVDQRAHGKSQGKCLSFGILEREDCAQWVQYASRRFGKDTPIVLYGVSMGAATVMMASDLPLQGNVVGIIADCGYTSPKDILIAVMTHVGLPPKLVYPFVRLGGWLFGGFDVESAGAETSLSRTNIPVLLIHGTDDRFVPYQMSEQNYAACSSSKELILIPGAPHAVACIVDTAQYCSAVKSFLERIGALPQKN